MSEGIAARSDKRRRVRLSEELRRALAGMTSKAANKVSAYSRQVEDADPFVQYYSGSSGGVRVLKPPYSPQRMYELYEENGVVEACVEAYVANVGGSGWEIAPVEGKEAEDVAASLEKVSGFFLEPNGMEGFQEILEAMLRDLFVTGAGFLEVVRTTSGEPAMIFRADSRLVRLCPMADSGPPVLVTVTLQRGKDTVTAQVMRRFRRYVMISRSETGANTFRYFKEFGDPRILNAITGEYVDTIDDPNAVASELIHFRLGNDVYGLPPWSGVVLRVLGMRRADYVNMDLFESQGVPPFILMLSGGQLTEESMTDLVRFFDSLKGVENFHKFLLLEAESLGISVDGKENTPKFEIFDLSQFRKEDVLFGKYILDSAEAIRRYGFRLPGLFVGASSEMNYATAFISRSVAEEQVFSPIRTKICGVINNTLVRDLGAGGDVVFRLRRVAYQDPDFVSKILATAVDSGAFTLNELIQFLQGLIGADISKREEEWANLPIPIFKKQVVEGAEASPESIESAYKALRDVQQLISHLGPLGHKPFNGEESCC